MAFDFTNRENTLQARQKAIESGYSAEEVDSFIRAKQEEQATASLIRKGEISISELARSNPILASQLVDEEVVSKPEETADTKKRKLILQQSAPVLERVISSALKAPTGATGEFRSQIGKIPGVEGGEAEFLRRDIEGFVRLIASAFASEVGVATDRDVKRWLAIMPQPGDTKNERIRQSNELIKQIQAESESLGVEFPPSIIQAAKLLAKEEAPKDSLAEASQKPQQATVAGTQSGQAGFFDIPGIKQLTQLGELQSKQGKTVADFLFPGTQKISRKIGAGEGVSGREVARSGVELGSLLFPAGKAGQLAGAVSKIPKVGGFLAGTGGRAAVTGAGFAATAEDVTPENVNEKLLTGAAVGALTQGVFGGAGKLTGALVNKAGQTLTQLFQPSPTRLSQFQKNTGFNFGDEIARRDGKAISGMDWPELISYFDKRFSTASRKVDDLLEKSNKTFDRNKLMQKLIAKAEDLQPQRGNVGQSSAINKLGQIQKDLMAGPRDLTAIQFNNIKRQLQDIGDEAFSPSGKASSTSKAVARLSTFVKKEIEDAVPSVKNLNKETQLYRLTRDSVRDRSSTLSRQVTQDPLSRLLQVFPFLAAGGGALAAGPGGAAGGLALGFLPTVLRDTLRSAPGATRRAAVQEKLSGSLPQNELLRRLGIITAGRTGEGASNLTQ